jgi:transcriptional regulator with XRE-family HTH domain
MTVARNVARLRNARGLTTIQLAKLLEDAGRPITASSITKLELGQRKVDVDDLIVIALALRVSPTALLLPPTADQHDSTPITSAGEIGADIAWNWLLGERPLEDDLPADDDGEVWNDFQTWSRPAGRRAYRATVGIRATGRTIAGYLKAAGTDDVDEVALGDAVRKSLSQPVDDLEPPAD